MEGPVRVGLIADDDVYFRMAVSAILTRQFGFSKVLEAASLDEALECLSENPDVCTALFDLSMSGMRTPTHLRAIRECFPYARIAVISGSSSRNDILLALEAGVHGYMPKSLSVNELKAALNTILDGGIYVPALLANLPCPSPQSAEPRVNEPAYDRTSPGGLLTQRQQEVLDLLVQGKTNKEIAIALRLGEGTVKIHMAAIFRYFGVNNRAAAAVAGARPYPNRKRNLLSGV